MLIILVLLSTCALAAEWVCPNCGKTTQSRFCGYCGTPQPQETAAPTAKPDQTVHVASELTAEPVNGMIADRAYAGLTNVKRIIIPDGTVSIGREAFSGCFNLTEVILPEGLTQIGEAAFENCFSLTFISIKGGTTRLEPETFKGCISLETIVLPVSVTSIGENCFAGCTALKTISLTGDTAEIGSRAFSGCTKLELLTLPGKTDFAEEDPFESCASLKIFAAYETAASDYAIAHGFMDPEPEPEPESTPAAANDSIPAISTSGGHWEWVITQADCPSCVGGSCSVCNGTGWYRMYGEAVPCRIYCPSCGGLGTYTSREYRFFPD